MVPESTTLQYLTSASKLCILCHEKIKLQPQNFPLTGEKIAAIVDEITCRYGYVWSFRAI
jgi:hypothetical protein